MSFGSAMSKTKQASLRTNDVINASEIGQYVYCSISWYLQRCGHKPDSPLLEIGKKVHIDLGKTIDSIQNDVRLSRRYAAIGYLFLIITISIILFRVIL